MASKDFADVKVIYGNKEHNFHKLVLCSQSGFFAKSLINFKEGKESKVVLKHGDIGTLDAMFSFLNSGDYDYKEVYGKLSSTMDGKKVNWKKAGGARGSGEKFQTTNEEYQPEEGINYIKKAQDVHYLLFHVNVYCLAGRYFPSYLNHSH
jgi:hypothetical protein